jgi:hypothetical protein
LDFERRIERSWKGYAMRKFSYLSAAALVVALCSGASANALQSYSAQHHVRQVHHASAKSLGEIPVTPASAPNSQWNGYVDYRSVGLSGNPDDCNKGCAVTTGQ